MKDFYVVTKTSVYLVEIRLQRIKATKIALEGESSIPLGSFVTGPKMVIGRIMSFYSSKAIRNCKKENVEKDLRNTLVGKWETRSTEISGLFFDMEKAKECFKKINRLTCDRHWIRETLSVLKEAEKNSKFIHVCKTKRHLDPPRLRSLVK